MNDIYGHMVKNIGGEELSLNSFKGKLLLIVNVASKCGFTPQYEGLENLYKNYKDKGLEILAFPCNQFGGQEPGSDEEVEKFCETNYKITFSLFSKIDVNGSAAHPLYRDLKKACPGLLGTEAVKWNFTKFLVGKDGKPIKRFAPKDSPADIEKELKELL